ncbi:Uncharacterised protein [Mycobacteroides abscessus subsp. abscessus]|nr:Uncharacterised protein [Mycobacteroides abscessus subsp. abscessus]
MRSSEVRAAFADFSESATARWICASIPLSANDNRPTSVRGSRSGTRRSRCPAAMSAAVASTSASGRRLRCTNQYPATPSTVSTAIPIATCNHSRSRTVVRTSVISRATVV